MINKLYEKIVTFIKEEYLFIILMVIILFLGFFRLPYNIYVGGGIINLDNRIIVKDSHNLSGSYNISYVKSLRATIPSYLLSFIFDWERESIESVKVDENDNPSDMWKREELYLDEANDNAIIAAYKLKGSGLTINKEILKVLYLYKESDTDLKIGDTIISINNVPLKEFSDIKEIIKDFNVNDMIEILYDRDGDTRKGYFILKEIENQKKAGLYLVKLYDYDIDKEISFKYKSTEGGSSGGFMSSLYIYNKISKDITKGRKIVGTGTIDSNGNVGEIGGVKYKLKGAVSSKADIFLLPESNYEEAIKEKKKNNYQIEIVKVKTLADAVDYLEGM